MDKTVNVYCDESCHLLRDASPVMVLGALTCPVSKAREIADRLRAIKQKHGLKPSRETKWIKVSPGKYSFYEETIDYFFGEADVGYRAWVIPDKRQLDHDRFGQDHDSWYYKMYFKLLEPLISPDRSYRIYVDKKDTQGGEKVQRLRDELCNSMFDFDHRIIERIQIVHSHEIEAVQLCDLLTGIVTYANRQLQTSDAKRNLVRHVEMLAGRSLLKNTLIREPKLNVYHWRAQA